MSQLFEGNLTVKKVSGRNGAFCVADLVTSVATFKVKDAILDQFEPGSYAGKFLVSSITLKTYFWRGTAHTEMRATLEQIFLEQAEPEAVEDQLQQAEADVFDETNECSPQTLSSPSPSTPEIEKSPVPPGTTQRDAPNDEALFGEIYAYIKAGIPVKLDPSLDRVSLRKQRDRLGPLGYEFKANSQTWYKK